MNHYDGDQCDDGQDPRKVLAELDRFALAQGIHVEVNARNDGRADSPFEVVMRRDGDPECHYGGYSIYQAAHIALMCLEEDWP